MTHKIWFKRIIGLTGAAILISSCNTKVNETVYVKDGETRDGDITVVNGGVVIGNNCNVKGSCRTVNGTVLVGDQSFTKSILTVNGGINIGRKCVISGEINCVNGSVSVKNLSEIGEITAVNGEISLYGVKVLEDISTTAGDITLTDSTEVKGDIVIVGKVENVEQKNRVDIFLKNGSIIHGSIYVKDKDQLVRLNLSRDSKVLGNIENVEIIYQ